MDEFLALAKEAGITHWTPEMTAALEKALAAQPAAQQPAPWTRVTLEERLGAQPAVEPVAWVRFCSDGTYEGPIMDCAMEDVRKKSGAWTPLYASPTAQPAAPDVVADARRYRWLREQHEGKDSGETFCVFAPNRGMHYLDPVGSMPGELDAAIDAELPATAPKE